MGKETSSGRWQMLRGRDSNVLSKSIPAIAYYGGEIRGESAMELEEDIGENIVHQYTVENDGPWSVNNLTVVISFPYEVQSPFPRGKWALYPMEYPIVKIPIPGKSV